MLCKEALELSSGDESKAIIWLRQRGIPIPDGKSGRQTHDDFFVFL
jgi:translation elongation factor EF-Ts